MNRDEEYKRWLRSAGPVGTGEAWDACWALWENHINTVLTSERIRTLEWAEQREAATEILDQRYATKAELRETVDWLRSAIKILAREHNLIIHGQAMASADHAWGIVEEKKV